jgi:hypothetical protein
MRIVNLQGDKQLSSCFVFMLEMQASYYIGLFAEIGYTSRKKIIQRKPFQGVGTWRIQAKCRMSLVPLRPERSESVFSGMIFSGVPHLKQNLHFPHPYATMNGKSENPPYQDFPRPKQ